MSTPRLLMTGVRKAFGPTQALAGVDLSVEAGEVHALVGENGAGKSTLMKVLAGACQPDEGSLELDGLPFRPATPLEARRAGVAMVYQELSLVPHLSVAENISLGREPSRFGLVQYHEMHASVANILARLGHADIDPAARVGALPLAMQQLVEIGRAVSHTACRILVLDEPTSSLTRDDVERLFGLVRHLRDQGLAVIYISHVIEEVERVADRFTVLRDGCTVGTGAVASTSAADIVGLMAGRRMEQLFPRSARAPGAVALEIRDVAGVVLPRSASLILRRGEVLGIAGLAGAGRTELLRAVFGLDPVRRGEIRVGAFIGPASPAARLAQGVGLLSEDRKREGLALPLSIADNLTLSRLSGLGPLTLVSPAAQRRVASDWIDRLAIRCHDASQPVWQLSGGNQQKVALARLLYHDVDVLLLDEPTRGIDVTSKAQIYELVDRLALAGKAVLLVSSYLPELLGICDRLAVMRRGVLGPARLAAECSERSVLMEATGLA